MQRGFQTIQPLINMSNPIIEYVPNVWNTWTESTGQISFQTQKKCVGNGEEKLAAELKIETKLGGQNNTVDLFHPTIGKISVKDMTSDDCTLYGKRMSAFTKNVS